jgi:hypothetical protein
MQITDAGLRRGINQTYTRAKAVLDTVNMNRLYLERYSLFAKHLPQNKGRLGSRRVRELSAGAGANCQAAQATSRRSPSTSATQIQAISRSSFAEKPASRPATTASNDESTWTEPGKQIVSNGVEIAKRLLTPRRERHTICYPLTSTIMLKRVMKRNDIYLNEFHRQQHEQARSLLSRRPKQSLDDAMTQYDRIKRGSSRTRRRFANPMKAETK